jgi:sRNA-binding regulator protein Hfq
MDSIMIKLARKFRLRKLLVSSFLNSGFSEKSSVQSAHASRLKLLLNHQQMYLYRAAVTIVLCSSNSL